MPSRLTVVLVSLLLASPAVIFWLWLLILPTGVVLKCPEKCRCDLDGYLVNCSGSGSNSIRLNISTDIRVLLLYNISIASSANDSFVFRGMVYLRTLQADFCELRKIELGTFNALTMLTQLSLRGNEISEIIPGTFEKLSRLENLMLDYNRIEQLDSDTFYGLVNLKNLSLEGNKLQYLHPDTFVGLQNIQNLFLSYNTGLHVPTDRHFINLNSLKHLGLSGCSVSSVSVETFANVSALESLELGNNYLRILDMNIMKVLPELSELNIELNDISEIIPGAFEKKSSLEFLYLGNNIILSLEADVFSGLINLKYISLVANKLQYLHPDTFVGLPNIKFLFLSYNFGLQIPTDRHFINSHSLKFLYMSACNINSISVQTFADVSALQVLDLGNNYLSRLDINILKTLPKLSELYLYFNPLQCDCQLQEVWRWCQDHNIQTAYKEFAPECDTPSEVQGMWWGVLKKGQCVEGNIHYHGDYTNTSYSYTPIKETDRETEKEKNVSSFVQQYKLPISVILFTFGTIGNVIIIIIISCNKHMRTVPNMYILNLAISDIIYLTTIFSDFWPGPVPWSSDFLMCSFIPFCYRMSVGLTAYSIAVLSIQRYRVTVDPLQFRVSSQPTWRVTGATICGVWIVAALCAVPETRSRIVCGARILLGITNYYHYVVLFDFLVSCVIPLCVIAFSYIMTACHLVKNSRAISEGTQNHQLNTRKKTAEVVLGLTAVFLISYVPYHIWKIYFYFSMNSDISGAKSTDKIFWANNLNDVITTLYLLLLINSCLNPVALFFTSLSFRRKFKRYLASCCKANYPTTEFELTRRN